MEPGSSWLLILLVILVGLSAIFSASETALTSLSKIRLRNMMEENIKNADKIYALVENPSKLLSTILIGNNLVNISASSIATALAIDFFSEGGVGIATGIMTIVILIFGEITPKTLASQNAEKISLKVVRFISLLVYIGTPVVAVFNVVTNFIIRILGGNPAKQTPLITEAELKTMVNVSHEEGVLEVDEREMINNVFDFGDAKAKDVMTPRTDMVSISTEDTYEEIVEAFREERYSRLPVYQDNIDNIVGILHLKDMAFISKADFDLETLMREPFFTYEFKGISELFSEMKANNISIAIVLDEYGGTSGLLTVQDLVEEIVGDISDEYDDDEEDEIQVVKEDEYIIDGSTKLEDVNEMIGTKLESEDFDTIGGYVVGLLGRFPEVGETVEQDNMKVVIEEVDKNRIEKLRIYT